MKDDKSCRDEMQLEEGVRKIVRTIFDEFDRDMTLASGLAAIAAAARHDQIVQAAGNVRSHRDKWRCEFGELVALATEHLLHKANRIISRHQNPEVIVGDFWSDLFVRASEHSGRFANFFGQAAHSHSPLGYILCAVLYAAGKEAPPPPQPPAAGAVEPQPEETGPDPAEMQLRALDAVLRVGKSSQGDVEERQYHVYVAHVIVQVDSKTVAKFHGISSGTVRADVHRFRERLREYVQRHDSGLSEYLRSLGRPRPTGRAKTGPKAGSPIESHECN